MTQQDASAPNLSLNSRYYDLARRDKKEVAGLIAAEVISQGVSSGWQETAAGEAAAIADTLDYFKICQVEPGAWRCLYNDLDCLPVSSLNALLAGLNELISSVMRPAVERANNAFATSVVSRRLMEQGAIVHTDDWLASVSQEVAGRIQVPLAEARDLAHLALCHLAGLTDLGDRETLEMFRVTRSLVAMARNHPRNSGLFRDIYDLGGSFVADGIKGHSRSLVITFVDDADMVLEIYDSQQAAWNQEGRRWVGQPIQINLLSGEVTLLTSAEKN